MSKRSRLKTRIHTLGEIKSILGAMKNLSIIEMNKVSRFLGAQNEFSKTIEEALGDFERHFRPARDVKSAPEEAVYVLLGSERGFCGAFNDALLVHLREAAGNQEKPVKIISIGRKLGSKLEGDPRLVDALEGPSAAEEIAACISNLADTLARLPITQWTLIHHGEIDGHDEIAVIDPFAPRTARHSESQAFRPLLNLDSLELYPRLFEQYLFSVLYRAFYLSFLAENRERLRHMEGALSSLDREWNRMRRLNNSLRQEETTEELEVIMLSAKE